MKRAIAPRRLGAMRRIRRGSAALEEVMILAVMIPLIYAVYELARSFCVHLYDIIRTAVDWAFL